MQIIKNFIYLSQTVYELFPQQREYDIEASNVNDVAVAVAMRLMSYF